MAPHSSTLAWRIPWMEEPGGLQSMGSLRVGHDWLTSLSLFTFMHWRRKWQPTPVFLPGESQGQRSLLGAVYGVTQSRTWLTWLSSSSNAGDPSSVPGSGRSPGEGNGNHSSILAWRIPWMEEPGRLQSRGSQRVGHDWATSLSLSLSHLIFIITL